MLGNRPASRILRAPFSRPHYVALAHAWRTYVHPVAELGRYLGGGGTYPRRVALRTPLGVIRPRLYSPDDLVTVNEVFCRHDYAMNGARPGRTAGPGARTATVPGARAVASPTTRRVVVDVGANLGLASLYFLTRDPGTRVVAVEPDPRNLARFRDNLLGYEDRLELHPVALDVVGGRVAFGTDPTGRYGAIGADTGSMIEVEARAVTDLLDDVLARVEEIELLKLDTEGTEAALLEAIPAEMARRIRRIVLEIEAERSLVRPGFDQRQYGSVRRLTRTPDVTPLPG